MVAILYRRLRGGGGVFNRQNGTFSTPFDVVWPAILYCRMRGFARPPERHLLQPALPPPVLASARMLLDDSGRPRLPHPADHRGRWPRAARRLRVRRPSGELTCTAACRCVHQRLSSRGGTIHWCIDISRYLSRDTYRDIIFYNHYFYVFFFVFFSTMIFI